MLIAVGKRVPNCGIHSDLVFGFLCMNPRPLMLAPESRPPPLTLRAKTSGEERRDELSNLARIAAPLLLPRRMRLRGSAEW